MPISYLTSFAANNLMIDASTFKTSRFVSLTVLENNVEENIFIRVKSKFKIITTLPLSRNDTLFQSRMFKFFSYFNYWTDFQNYKKLVQRKLLMNILREDPIDIIGRQTIKSVVI